MSILTNQVRGFTTSLTEEMETGAREDLQTQKKPSSSLHFLISRRKSVELQKICRDKK